MPLTRYFDAFDSAELTMLHASFEAACSELGLKKHDADNERRARLAAQIVKLAQTGERDAETLKRRAVTIVRSSA